jgi:hypothetical protein
VLFEPISSDFEPAVGRLITGRSTTLAHAGRRHPSEAGPKNAASAERELRACRSPRPSCRCWQGSPCLGCAWRSVYHAARPEASGKPEPAGPAAPRSGRPPAPGLARRGRPAAGGPGSQPPGRRCCLWSGKLRPIRHKSPPDRQRLPGSPQRQGRFSTRTAPLSPPAAAVFPPAFHRPWPGCAPPIPRSGGSLLAPLHRLPTACTPALHRLCPVDAAGVGKGGRVFHRLSPGLAPPLPRPGPRLSPVPPPPRRLFSPRLPGGQPTCQGRRPRATMAAGGA